MVRGRNDRDLDRSSVVRLVVVVGGVMLAGSLLGCDDAGSGESGRSYGDLAAATDSCTKKVGKAQRGLLKREDLDVKDFITTSSGDATVRIATPQPRTENRDTVGVALERCIFEKTGASEELLRQIFDTGANDGRVTFSWSTYTVELTYDLKSGVNTTISAE